jgi:hypothetical protein
VVLDDGRFAYRTTPMFAVQWTVREQQNRPSFGRVTFKHHEVAQVTYGGFWHVNPNTDIEGTVALREAVDRYFDTH